MNRTEFDTLRPLCKHCQGACEVRPGSGPGPGEDRGVYCTVCGQYQLWLAKDRAEERRPKLKVGTIPQVWAAWGEHCAHCGLNTAQLEVLGLARTVQHVPPYKEQGDTGQLIPLCDWCQQDSASRMKRLETLVARLTARVVP